MSNMSRSHFSKYDSFFGIVTSPLRGSANDCCNQMTARVHIMSLFTQLRVWETVVKDTMLHLSVFPKHSYKTFFLSCTCWNSMAHNQGNSGLNNFKLIFIEFDFLKGQIMWSVGIGQVFYNRYQHWRLQRYNLFKLAPHLPDNSQ